MATRTCPLSYLYDTYLSPVINYRNKETKEVVKYFKASVSMQAILNLFKRFEFQIGTNLEDIDKNAVREIEG